MIRRLALIITGLAFLFQIQKISAQSVGVGLYVGDTTMTLQGSTTPDSQVTFMEGNTVIGTTLSDEFGDFSKTFVAQDGGIVEIGIFSSDPMSNPTPLTLVSVSLTPTQETIVPNIILPATIYLSITSVEQGESFVLTGYASPDSNVRIFISGLATYLSTTATDTGYWEYLVPTDGLSEGEYELYIKVYSPSNNSSINSEVFTFEVVDSTPDETDSGTSSSGSGGSSVTSAVTAVVTTILETVGLTSEKVIRALPSWFSYFDIDGSGLIELSELRIALRRWIISVQRSTADSNCDLDYNGICDIIDFSILLYYIDN